MRKYGVLGLLFLTLAVTGLYGFSKAQGSQIDRAQLRSMLDQLGFEVRDLVKDPGKEKYAITVTQGGLDIPIGAELSGNGNYIWLTVNLGEASETLTRSYALLKQNGKIQPSHFYVTETSGRLMMGLPIENRNVTNAILRQRIDSITSHVVTTEPDWEK